MKIIKACIVGCGNRGQVYGDYSLDKPEELKVIAIVDPNPFKLEECKKKYGLDDKQCFKTVKEFVDTHIECDIVFNSTMDQFHLETSLEILNAKYNMLVEKPIVNNGHDLALIKNAAKKNNCLVFVCHVLRYTPFYRTIKQLLVDNKIGEIITMEMNEHVCLQHYLTSYLRGKWNSEEKCGSGLLLAKSCHDIDIMCWLNNSSRPVKVTSSGGRYHFIKENAPKDATEYCYQCPYKDSCENSATTLYLKHNTMPFLVWDRMNKDLDSITKEEKEEYLKHDIYGRCAYKIDSDLVDRQVCNVSFANGSVASFTLLGNCAKADRYIHIVGTKGEIEGKLEENKITLRTFKEDVWEYKTEVIDLKEKVINNARFGGHSGGDFLIMHDLCCYLNNDKSSISITKLDDSLNGHLTVYALEKSRKNNSVETVEEI